VEKGDAPRHDEHTYRAAPPVLPLAPDPELPLMLSGEVPLAPDDPPEVLEPGDAAPAPDVPPAAPGVPELLDPPVAPPLPAPAAPGVLDESGLAAPPVAPDVPPAAPEVSPVVPEVPPVVPEVPPVAPEVSVPLVEGALLVVPVVLEEVLPEVSPLVAPVVPEAPPASSPLLLHPATITVNTLAARITFEAFNNDSIVFPFIEIVNPTTFLT
jgi:hypothetical protein